MGFSVQPKDTSTQAGTKPRLPNTGRPLHLCGLLWSDVTSLLPHQSSALRVSRPKTGRDPVIRTLPSKWARPRREPKPSMGTSIQCGRKSSACKFTSGPGNSGIGSDAMTAAGAYIVLGLDPFIDFCFITLWDILQSTTRGTVKPIKACRPYIELD